MDQSSTNKIKLLLQILIGILFIFSAISKLFPVEAFDFTLVSQGITSWQTAPYLSRIIIAIELSIGVSFLIGKNLKKLLIPAAFVLLLIFSIHLTYQLIKTGSTGNCGCFGQLLPMSTIEALIKNLFLLIILIYLYKSGKAEEKLSLIRPSIIFIVSAGAIFFVFQVKSYRLPENKTTTAVIKPSNSDSTVSNKETTINHQIYDNNLVGNETGKKEDTKSETSKYKTTISPFSEFNKFSDGKIVDLDKGKKVLAFFSLDCDDCMNAAKKITELSKKTNLPPIYILFLGEQDEVQKFFSYAGKEYPYKIISPETFFPFIKDYPPRVVLLYNGNIIGDWDNKTFSDDKLKTAVTSLQ